MAVVPRDDSVAPPRSRRSARGAFLALTSLALLSTLVPVLVVAAVLARRSPVPEAIVWPLGLLLALSVTLLLTGSYLVWRAGVLVASPPALAAPASGPGRRGDGEALASGEGAVRLLARVETQAEEIGALATRLEGAYQELEATTARLKQLSFKDDVTGLYNRRFFSMRLEEEVSRYRRFNRPVSVVLLDLDGFKAVNDLRGHAAGDETLRDIAHILIKQSRGINVIARYGGDEFAVLLVETPKVGAQLYADRIRQVVAKHSFGDGFTVTASFGVSSLPEDDAPSPEELVRAADEALYAAKRGGKNQVVGYEPKTVASQEDAT